jgi:hypothetical protein
LEKLDNSKELNIKDFMKEYDILTFDKLPKPVIECFVNYFFINLNRCKTKKFNIGKLKSDLASSI